VQLVQVLLDIRADGIAHVDEPSDEVANVSVVRLASWNLLHGVAPSDGVTDATRLAEAAAALDADVLCLQEVDRDQPRSGLVDQTAIVADALGAQAWRFEAALAGTPDERWTPVGDAPVIGAAYGVGLVSRLPVRSWHLRRLDPPRVPMLMPGAVPKQSRNGVRLGRPQVIRDAPRVVLAAVVETRRGPMTVGCCHLTYVQGWNVAQLRQALELLRPLPAPRFLLGDLNMAGRLPALTSQWRPLVRGRTFPAWRPRLQIDHVLAEGHVEVLGSSVQLLPVSDHRAVVVDVDDSPRPLR
jgi:endonuclease/exonuclease/phosphatase family metal-dependent hydrolase